MSASVSIASVTGERVDVADAVFGCEFNEGLVHQAVVAHLAAGRSGSKAQKSRGEVRGGGRKPWRQKRGGRARAGSIRSPIWRGGGRTFAAKPRDHAVKLNRKMHRAAIRCIFSELVRHDRLISIPVQELIPEQPKTKLLLSRLDERGLLEQNPSKLLIIVAVPDRNLQLAARNLPQVEVRDVDELDSAILVAAEQVLIGDDALKIIEERLS